MFEAADDIGGTWFWNRYPGARCDSESYFYSFSDRLSVRTDDGGQVTATYLITAVRCLTTTDLPDFPGRHTFLGDSYHTGVWPHEGVDVTGKRLAVIDAEDGRKIKDNYREIWQTTRETGFGFPYHTAYRTALGDHPSLGVW